MEKFIEWLEEDIKYINDISSKPLIMEVEEERFKNETKCSICKGKFNNDKDFKVGDHCHFTGRFRGAAHNSCNLKYKKPDFTPIVFHNLSGYDSHLFIRNLGNSEGDLDCIPNNDEKYISFPKRIEVVYYEKKVKNKKTGEVMKETKIKYHKMRFIDSNKCMNTSLDKLVNNLPETAFNNLKRYYTGDKFNLVKRKGVFQYEYLVSLERLEENKLPLKKYFFSRLTAKDITNEDYQHAKKVWTEFEMKTLKDYLELYNETDVLLLADVFENFRSICLENYLLDPAWYFTAPGLAWDAALKITKVELELLTDVDMLLMVEKGIRGGVSMISTRYAKANNKYMRNKYDVNEVSKYIVYLDKNNLYGTAMINKLPVNGFKWMNNNELLVWRKHPCILEVDLEYPKDLHALHNDYPLAPERVMCKNNVEKLIPNLSNKKNYVVHHDTLKQYLDLGMKITCIHRGIKFNESEWLNPYIDLNTKLRTQGKTEFEKDFFKLMNNSVYSKTLEDIRNRVDVKLVSVREKARKLVSKINFKRCKIFSENLVGIHMKKTNLFFNKPVYLGMSILDISKSIMYEFHYN